SATIFIRPSGWFTALARPLARTGELPGLDLVAGFARLLLGEADAADLRLAVRRARQAAIVERRAVEARQALDDHHALGRRDVREVHDAGDVADGVHARRRRLQGGIGLDPAALELHAGAVERERVDGRLEADADEHALGIELLLLALRGEAHGRAAVADLCAGDLRAGEEIDALLLERALDLDADLLVLEREEVVEQLEDGHVDAVGPPEVG